MKLQTYNPANGKLINEYKNHTIKEIENIINLSYRSFKSYKLEPISKRLNWLSNIAELLILNKIKLSEIITIEMGKPISQSIAEIEKSAWVCRHYAENGESIFSKLNIPTGTGKETELDTKSYVYYEPLGIILAIMPWNFPFWQVFRFVAPNLAIGNAILLKHSPNTTGCAIEIEKILLEAGLPEFIFNSIVIDSSQVPVLTPVIIENNFIAGVTVTGSLKTGSVVASLAGKSIKKTVLELGGSDPYIIFDDADIVNAVNSCVLSRMLNCGQTCISAKRFIIQDSIYNKFLEMFIEKMNEFKYGNPLDTETNLGPMARSDLRQTLHEQVKSSVRLGANLITGGKIPEGKGYYYPPTILTDIPTDSPAYKEELFGPVVVLFKFNNEAEAIILANDTNFGLGASIFTSDIEKAERMATDFIQSGTVFINDFVKSDPRLPFGGIKNSGYGRELSQFGATEFTNIKTIVVKEIRSDKN